MVSTQIESPRTSDEAGQEPLAARYRVRERLSETKLLACDLATSSDVVLKVVPSRLLPPGAIMRLEYEVAQLQRLPGHYVTAPCHIERRPDQLLVVSPYVPGSTLRELLSQRRLALPEALAIGYDIFSALRDMHREGLLHRAVRPSNIVVDSGEPETKTTLIDFGPAYNLVDQSTSSRRAALAAAHYLSPEQAGSLDCDITPASDLYAAGVTLYHCLAGQPPFTASEIGSVLFAHMTSPVPNLRSHGISIPRALEEMLQRLLRKDPRDRYQTADAVLVDLAALRAGLQRGEREPLVVVGASDDRRSLSEPAFVGRAHELAVLDERLDQARAGKAELLLVEGASGSGKTRLLTELAQRAACRGFTPLWGRGAHDVARQPFALLAGIVDSFLAAAETKPDWIDTVRRQLGHHAPAVCSALPRLANVLGATELTSTGPEEAGELRTLHALSSFLAALGSPDQPVLVVLDDCQWADDLTCRLIHRWNAGTDPALATRHVLVVAAFRTEEVGPNHWLRAVRTETHLRLPPLTAAEVAALVESMAGAVPPAVVEAILQLADHSPFMVSALLRGLVESGNLVREPDGWRLSSLDLGGTHSSNRAAAVLAQRLALLPPHTLSLLSVGAILGKEFPLDLAAALAHHTPQQAIAAVDVARARQLIWVRPDGTRCVFVHDKIRAAVLERFSADDLRRMHGLAANYLRAHLPDRVADIAYHYDAAGDSNLALPFALQAADEARARYALEAAEQQLLIAERGAQSATRETRYRIAVGLGEAHLLRGHYDAAGREFELAAAVAEGALAKAQIRGQQGELAFKRGDMERSIAFFESALRLLGRYVPSSRATLLLLVLWETLIQILHTVLPWARMRYRRPPNPRERLTLRLLSNLAHGSWYCRSLVHVMWAHLRGLNLAERFAPSTELAHSYAEHAPGLTLVGYLSRAESYARKSLELRQRLGDLWGQGQSLHYWGVVLYAGSRFQECIQKCREAIRLLERTGDYWQVHIARYQIAASLYRLGDLAGAVEEARRNHLSGMELGDEQASGISLDVWVRATRGTVPHDIMASEFSRLRHDAQGRAQVLFAHGLALARREDFVPAEQALRQAMAVTDTAGVRNAYTLPFRPWLATVLREQARRLHDQTPGRRTRLLRAARATARAAVRWSWLSRNDLPHALRELGLIAAMLGAPRLARAYLRRSLDVAHAQGARFEHAQTLLACAELGQELGWHAAADERREALAQLGALNALPGDEASGKTPHEEATLSLSDRFDGVLDWGRRIASALTAQAVYEEASQAVIRLLRAERCLVLGVADEGRGSRFYPLSGELSGAWHEERLRESVGLRRAQGFVENFLGSPTDHSTTSGERSALCVPLFVRGAAVACLYATHERVRGLFGRVEERLAEFIATIAGAALENAEGFTQLQTLNETLERRVAERTAAAESRARELAQSNEQLEQLAQDLLNTQRQLTDAKQAAEEASQAKSRFLATMSHEIRTPMNGILGMTELALRSELSAQQRRCLTTVKDSAHSLLIILNDILDFSKIEAGRMELEAIPLCIADVIADALQLVSVAAARKGLELIGHVATNVPECLLGDPNRLRQVLANLVSNAVKFTECGEVFVTVAREHSGQAFDDAWHFAVHDTGIGIPADKQQCIFDAFRQSDSSMTRRYGGTGLGLAISSELVGLMGGRLWVESEPGQGSVFHFVVRLARPDPRPPAVAAPFSGRHGRVVVASASARARTAYAALLEAQGLAATAWDSASGPPCEADLADADILVLDIAAPQSTELGLLAALPRFAGAHRLPILALIPSEPVDLAERCAQLGMEQCLLKPVGAKELVAAVRTVRRGRHPSSAEMVEHAEAPAMTRAMRILVADDSPVNQEVVSGLLELSGHAAVCVATGREAVEAMRREPFDAVLMDLEMPEMDGLTAAALIRELERERSTQTPIIALSAHTLASFRDRCLAAGMAGYLHKPLEPEQLFATLQRVCRTAGQQHEIPEQPRNAQDHIAKRETT